MNKGNTMEDQLILLGTKGGPSVRQKGAMPTASLLQMNGHTIVIDCGIGLTRSIADAGVNLLDVDVFFITHLHSDHLLELGPLIYTIWTTGLTRKLSVYGPVGIEEYWHNFMQSMDFDHGIRIADDGRSSLIDMIDLHVFGEGQVTELDGVKVSALRVDHPPVTECYALRFDHEETSIVFSADTCYFPPLAEFSKGADILVHEAMLENGVESILRRTPGATGLKQHLLASHTMAPYVGRIARDAGVGTLVLNHLIPADDPAFTDADWESAIAENWNGPLIVGKDGMKIPIRKP